MRAVRGDNEGRHVRIRSGRGLGDSIYLRAIAGYLVARGDTVTALSDYPDIFIDSGTKVEPFTRAGANIRVAHYTHTMQDQSLTQYAEMLRSAALPEDVPLRFNWRVRNRALVDAVQERAAGRPLILVHGGRAAMQRTDGFSADMLPQREAFNAVLHALDACYSVRIGAGPHVYDIAGIAEDLRDRTSVSDLLDLAVTCDGIVAQCSFAVPLAEVFDKPLLAVWAARGLKTDRNQYIRHVTPAKVLQKTATTSGYLLDEWPAEKIDERVAWFWTQLIGMVQRASLCHA